MFSRFEKNCIGQPYWAALRNSGDLEGNTQTALVKLDLRDIWINNICLLGDTYALVNARLACDRRKSYAVLHVHLGPFTC